MKKCTKCYLNLPLSAFDKNKNKKDGHVYECKSCRSKRDRKYYLTSESRKLRSNTNHISAKKYADSNLENIKIYQKVKYAIKVGRLKKSHCKYCGETKNVIGHHSNYNKPLDIEWMCKFHHKSWHKIFLAIQSGDFL